MFSQFTLRAKVLCAVIFAGVATLVALQWIEKRSEPIDLNEPSFSEGKPVKRDSQYLANLIQISEDIFSGGSPETIEGFRELKELGILTVVSVDGARPKIDMAEQMGLGYIHIPIGYDDISDEEKATLASIFSKSAPPYYFHCHHGKHRGPAALASALILTEKMSLDQAKQFLEMAGTSKHYDGLWGAVINTPKITTLPSPLPLRSVSEVSSMAKSMAMMDEVFDNLKLLKAQGWQADPTKPDITPNHQALMLLEHLKEIPRTSKSDQLKDADFMDYLKTNTEEAKELEQSLRQNDFPSANKILKQMKSSCIDCHSDFRD